MKELRERNVKSVFGGIGIASLLCVLMVLMSWSAMVTNSDINSNSPDSADSQQVETKGSDVTEAEFKQTSFNANEIGFDEDYEMLGMRTTHSKTFINDDGNLQSVISHDPLHYTNQFGDLVDINTAILSYEDGYYVADVFTPVQFGHNPMDGIKMMIDGEILVSGLNPTPVAIYQGITTDPMLHGITVPFTHVSQVNDGLFMPPTDTVEVGGNSINYPMSSNIDMQYHVSANEVKQEFIINTLSKELRQALGDELEAIQQMANNRASGFFGMQETVGLPDDVELWTNGAKIESDGELYTTDSTIYMVDVETDEVIGYIAAPYAHDSSSDEKVTSIQDLKDNTASNLEPSTTYFLNLDGSTLTITTAVDIEWLIDDYTSFPVVIDPTVGSNTHLTDTAAGSYKVCVVADVDCHSQTDGEFRYDWASYGGYHQASPRFDFTFTQTTPYSVSGVSVVYEISSKIYAGSSDYAGLIVMEECGTYDPSAAYTDPTSPNLNSIYYPAECTGNPLADYPLPPPPPPAPTMHTFTGFTVYDDCETENDIYGTTPYSYSITSDMTQCDDGNSAGTLDTFDFVSATSSYESNGIFSSGTYGFTVTDIYNDGLDGDASIVFETRAVGSTSNTAWVDVLEICEDSAYSLTGTCNYAQSQTEHFLTVAAGEEMRIAYNCPGTGCYPNENGVNIQQTTPPPLLPTATPGAGGSPTGSEPADVSFTVQNGEEAYFEYQTGSNPGDADNTEIYYRAVGSSGWTTHWDLCSVTPPSNPPCQASTTYTSEDSVFIQTAGNYEALVWDTSGNGFGATPAAGGEVLFDTAGGTTGIVQASPSSVRLNTLISAEQIAKLPIGVSLNTPYTVQVCSGVSACSTGPMSMFVDAYQNGANGGYVEFGLGWANAFNSFDGWTSGQMDGGADFSSFYLIVELEDNTPDATPPSVESDAHYTGLTSYVEGARTLFLSIMDTDNLIDTTSADGPKLHYSTDGGNTYTEVAADSLNTCASKNTVCTFGADTSELSAGTTVDYFWTYTDAAANDNSKIPPQTPNPGRFPAAGAADLTFTIGDVYDATGSKLVTLLEDVSGPDYQTSGSVYSSGYMDRQVTYFAETGEFMFEFDFSDCGASSTSQWWIEDQCFWDADVYSVGDQSLGHWDINWEGVSSDCYPGATGCTAAPTNTLELDSHFGGILDVTRFGTDNFMLAYDSNSGEWMVSALSSTGIGNKLSTAMNDVVSQSYAANIVTPVGPTPQRSLLASSQSGTGGYVTNLIVNTGDIARIGYYDGGCCNTEQGVTVIDTATSAVYNMGRTYYASWRSWAQVPAQYVTSPCTSSACSFGYTASGSYSWSDSLSASVNSNMPNNGILNAGTYEIYFWDTYGDSTDGNRLYVETIAASAGFSGASSGPYDTNSLVTAGYTAESFIIDLADSSTPSLGTNSGFGGVSFGTAAGEFSSICVTTAGHMIFMDSSSECTPDATESSTGGSWQGFAIGATKTGQDLGNDGMLWQIRNIEPDPDNNAPVVTGGEIGDSHALDRTVTYTISDVGYAEMGVDTSPVPGVGPTIHYTITSSDGTVATNSAALTPSGDRNTCSATECDWTYQFSGLTRGDTVSYYMTAKDLYPPAPNAMQGNTYGFEVANPTNTLVVEWVEYKEESYTSAADACSMQVIMYDVTNEFEFLYDENCETDEKLGLTGIRKDQSTFTEVGNYDEFVFGNPHSNNWRFTLSPSGDYLVEPFDLGMNPLPLASSNQVVPVSTSTFTNDNRCDSNPDWAQYGTFCAGTFDIPDDFNFEFYGQSYDGADSLNRIQATGSGFIHFIDDGSTSAVRIEGNGGNCWGSSGASPANFWTNCGGASNILTGQLSLMAPYWSRETMDYCGTTTGTTPCQGVWYRTLPFDGQGKTVTADISDDTTWYLIDSPIKVNPTDPSGYLTVSADLTIEAGVEIIVGEGKGISFDGGLQADGTCAQFTTMGTTNDRVTFDADRSVNQNALWHGMAFTSDCGGTTVEDRHMITSTDFSNTNHAAITAGSRPADANGPSCGTNTQNCDIGEFTMDDVTFSNVESAFSHGSGQGTVVTMSNFAVNNARGSCFDFAANTVATLTGTALNPSTMTGCNTNNNNDGGAVTNVQGSNAGSLTMEYINIVDSKVSLIKTDLQMITITDVTATNPSIGDQYRWTDNGVPNPPTYSHLYDTTGVSLGLSHGANSEVVISNFDAQGYAQGWICAATKVSLTNVNLGTGFHNNHRFNIDPYCGAVTNTPGSTGVNSVFDDVTVADLAMYRTFPGTANQISVTNNMNMAELGVSGGPTDQVELNDISVGGIFTSDGCGADVKVMTSTVGQINSFCNLPSGTSSVEVVDSTIAHTSTDSAIYLQQSQGIFVNVDITSTTATANGPFLAFVDLSSDAYLIDVTLNGNDCADNNGKTADCYTGINGDTNVAPTAIPEIYYGAFANSLAYRQGVDSQGNPIQIPEQGVTVTASVLDSNGAEVFPSKVFYRALTGADGRATEVAVFTGDHTGTVYDSHLVRASGAAGAGEAHPVLADGTPATIVDFQNGVPYQAPAILAVDMYTMGNDISHQDGVTLLDAITTYESGNAPAGTLTWSWQSSDPSTTGSFDPDQDTSTGRVYWKSIAFGDATAFSGTNGYNRVYYGGVGVEQGVDVTGSVVVTATETYNFVSFDDEFGTYNIGSYADIRLVSPPVTLDDTGMDCAWMANEPLFIAADTGSAYEFKGATMVLAEDMLIDGCTVVLEGSKLIFREDAVNNPTLTIGNGGSLIMKTDSGTGDLPKIYGESNLDAVDIELQSGATIDMQSGTMKNFLLGGTSQLEVPSGAELKLGGGAYLTSSDISSLGASFPMINVDGGVVTVTSSATLAGAGNLGIGVQLTNGGEVNGDGLTVSNMANGINSDGGSMNLDGFTSSGNSVGIVAKDGPKLPTMYSSAVLQGIAQNYPQVNFGQGYRVMPGMDNCWFYHMYACFEWYEYTVDLSSWIGQADYVQPGMMITYGGTWNYYYSNLGGTGLSLWQTPYVSMDNLVVEVTDNTGATYLIDDATDIGYYPYGDNDPSVTSGTLDYYGGLGGAPFWDCNYRGVSANPWRWGERLVNYYWYSSSPNMGDLFGLTTSPAYPEEFGFRISEGTVPEPISVSNQPEFSWGFDDAVSGRFGIGFGPAAGFANAISNPGTWHDTTIGETRSSLVGTWGSPNYETCNARAPNYGQSSTGSNMMLNWPTLDLTDSSIEKVELKFDMMHRYFGSYTNWHANANADSVEVMARSGADPSNFGEYSEAVIGKGVILSNAEITDAEIGIDLQGGTLANINGLDIDDPVVYGVKTAGTNSVYIDGMDVDDSGLGANNNYGYFAPSTSAGSQEITNSNFNGLGTGIYLANDVGTTISNTVISNGDTGVQVSASSSANYVIDTMTLSNVDTGFSLDGTGDISMNDVDITSVTSDMELTSSSYVTFVDGVIDQAKVTIDSASTGKLNRDRSYIATLDADGNPLANVNVIMSSTSAATTSSGSTDASGQTSGLTFSIYDVDSSGVISYASYFNSYTISTVAAVDYSYTDEFTNSGDFRYVQGTPTLVDQAYDIASNVNHDSFSLVDTIDVRVCGTDSNYVMVAPCAGTLSSSGQRTYLNGMVEYGDEEGLHDGTSTMDLSGKAIMIDSGTLELRNDVTYILDNAIVFDTGYTTEYGTGIAQWISDYPYDTTLKMHGGEVNGLYPKTANGDVVGLVIGGLAGSNENPLNLDIDGVTFNNIIGLATGTGDRDGSSSTGSFNSYLPSQVDIKNSFIYYYRDFDFRPTLYSDADYCLRLSGVDSATVTGNTFANCVLGVAFTDSHYESLSSTAHSVIGADNVLIDGNTFVDTAGINIMGWADADADNLVLSNNVMSCSTCIHVSFQDDTSFNPLIDTNTFNGGDFGVYTDDIERVNVNGNTFNNQAEIAIRVVDGDFNADGNTINDAGEYAIYAESLEEPSELAISYVAGVNTDFPDESGKFVSWYGDQCPYWWNWYGIPCVSPDVYATNAAGQEMIIELIAGNWATELLVYVTAPDGSTTVWDPSTGNFGNDGEQSHNSGSPNPLVLDQVGTYVFYLRDTLGDGANGGGFLILQSDAGTWSGAGPGNPPVFWDPGVAGLLTTEPTGYRAGYPWNPSTSTTEIAYSNTMDGVLIQNTGTDPIEYQLIGIDTYGDGWDGTYMRAQVAPVGFWSTSTTGYPPSANNYGGGYGTSIGTIGIAAAHASVDSFTDGTYSDPLVVTLDAGYEMRFEFDCAASWCGEAALKITEVAEAEPWSGPTIANNDINFDSTNNNPLAVGLYLSNCDIQAYTITTESNTIDIGQNAVLNDGCAWNDQNSVFTGSDVAGSIGYNDDNTFSVNLGLDGTTISGFETGVYKTGGGMLEITNGATITAGNSGIGVHTDGIDVSVISATMDGGATGTGMLVENSQYAWLYPMDVTGNVGLHVKNSEILWDAGEVDADTILIAETVTGTVQSLTDPAQSGGPGVASASSTTMIDARSDTRLTVVNWPIDETKMIVDGTSVVDEANWLSIDANHLGDEPLSQVGVSIISDEDYTAYSSPIFATTMVVDGDNTDWTGGNELNPSGYAMPGSVGGPMYVTTDAGSVVLGFDSVDTTSSDVYVYVDSNDMAGSSTGFNGEHTLPYDADFAVVATSAGVDVYYYNDPAWVLNPTSSAVSAQGAFLEVSIPITALGGSSVDTMNIVATVQNAGTNDVTSVSPAQTTIVGTGAETLDNAYELALNKLDLADGTLTNEVLLHRSFEFSSTPTAPHNYQVMVKTTAEARHTCDFDWATEVDVSMDASKALSFDILRACPEITSLLDDIIVDEDSGAITFDLATFVDDEQDVEANMEWDVTEDNMDAFANILSDFSDKSGATGTYTVTPINDQFGTSEMTFEVVDSHGQTASKTITYRVKNINDAPVICDARADVDPDCDNGNVYLYADAAGNRYNSRDEGFTSYSKPLGKLANDTVNSFIRDMANEQDPVNQVYTWGADATCDQISVALQTNVNGVDEIVITENTNWEYGGICDITLTLSDDGAENTDAAPVVVQFAVAPINDAPVIAVEGVVESTDSSNAFQGVPDGSYRLDLVEDTTDADALTFDLSGIKSDIDHLDEDLAWTLTDTNTCNSANYYTHQISDDILEFTLIPDATTNAEPWEVDMLNNNGIHQTRTANGRCEMTLTLSDTAEPPSYMPNYEALATAGVAPNNYVQESVSVTLSVEVDNVAENVPDYFLDATEGFSFNGVNNVMPGTYVPVDFSINAGGDQGAYTYDHLLVVSLHSDGHTEIELPRYYNPPAYGQSLDIDDWEVYITDQTTEVWVEVDVVTCNPGTVCTPDNIGNIQTDNPESHNRVAGQQVFGKWSEPGRIGEDASGTPSNRRPAFEDKNWCNNMMTTNSDTESVAWSDATNCGHTEQGYNGVFTEDWQAANTPLPVTVTTIGALSVASFAPSIIAVALTGLFVSALVLAGRRDDDEEEFVEENISEDETAVSPVIATILMVAITVVLSGVVYVWAAQLADTDTKGVPRVTFDATNVDTGDTATDHWKISVGQAQTVLATQAVEVSVTYANAAGEIVTVTTNLASTNHVYGFSPFNSDELVTFGDVVTLNGGEVISSFSTGDDVYVKTHDAEGTPLVDATIRIVYNPPGEAQGAVLKTYSGLSWNQPV